MSWSGDLHLRSAATSSQMMLRVEVSNCNDRTPCTDGLLACSRKGRSPAHTEAAKRSSPTSEGIRRSSWRSDGSEGVSRMLDKAKPSSRAAWERGRMVVWERDRRGRWGRR